MRTTDMSRVNWLSVREVSKLWAPQLQIPASAIERELQIALYKLEKKYPFDKPIDVNPDTVDLPSAETLIDRDFIERFHDKELWKLPDFWFDDLPTGPSFPGRPSVMCAIVQELKARAKRDELAETLAAEARVLSAWASKTFPGQQTPTSRTVENGVRMVFKTLKAEVGTA